MLYAANRAWRLRTAADLVADVVPPPPDLYPQVREVLETHATVVCARLDGSDTSSVLPPISDDFVPALRAQARRTGRPRSPRRCLCSRSLRTSVNWSSPTRRWKTRSQGSSIVQ